MQTGDPKIQQKRQKNTEFESKSQASKHLYSFSGNQSSQAYENYQYIENELVWAKIIGYPWWPAIVNRKNFPQYDLNAQGLMQKKMITYEVCFLGENSHAQLDGSKLAQYLVNRNYFIQYGNKHHRKEYYQNFLQAVKQADTILMGIGEFVQFESTQNLWPEGRRQSYLEKRHFEIQQGRGVDKKCKKLSASSTKELEKGSTQPQEKDSIDLHKCIASKILKILKDKMNNYPIFYLKKITLNILKKNKEKESQLLMSYKSIIQNTLKMTQSQIIKKFMSKEDKSNSQSSAFKKCLQSPRKSQVTWQDLSQKNQQESIQDRKIYYQMEETDKLHLCLKQPLKEESQKL